MAGAEFSILYAIQEMRTPFLDWFFSTVTHLGDAGIFWILTGLVLFACKKTRRVGAGMLLSLTAGLLVGNIFLKNLVARERPCWLDPGVMLLVRNPSDYSFPSGHSMAAFECAVTLLFYHRKWGIATLFLAVIISFSRLYLFVHFPTDVLAGILIGIMNAVLVYKIMEHFRKGSHTCIEEE